MGELTKEASEGAKPADSLTLDFQPPELLLNDLLKPQVCGGLSWQSQLTKHHRCSSWPSASSHPPQEANLHPLKDFLARNFNSHGEYLLLRLSCPHLNPPLPSTGQASLPASLHSLLTRFHSSHMSGTRLPPLLSQERNR